MTQRRILIVDDEPIIIEMLAQLLMIHYPEAALVTAGTGLTALEQAQANYFDLVLTDYQLPDMSGLSVARILYSLMPSVQVVMMTGGLTKTELYKLVRRHRIDGYLVKPFSCDQVCRLCDELLTRLDDDPHRDDE